MKTFLKTAQQLGELRLFDLQFARHLTEVNGKEVPELLLASALASNRISHGDTCLSLDTVKSSSLYTNPDLRVVRQKLPALDRWREVLLQQKVVSAAPVGGVSESRLAPLVLDENNRLYLARYWVLEQSLIKSVSKLLDREMPRIDDQIDYENLAIALDKLFNANDSGPDWQKAAVANAVINNFCVITGGPGTGKTYTVTALLAMLIYQGVEPRKIALAAPTGKASTRLTQSIQRDLSGLLQALDLPDASFESVTLHKLLGARPGRVQPRHHKDAPLLYDVIIIDEASMIDLPMMARTFEALSNDTRIVLIGDKDQLHSVESGMVLGDICGGRAQAELSAERCDELSKLGVANLPVCCAPGGKIADHIVYLEKSHRVQDDGGISKLAGAVNTGNAEAALQLLNETAQPNLTLLPHESLNLENALREHVLPTCEKYASAATPLQALESMSDVGVLCALRRGPTGSLRVNAIVERLLADAGVVERGQSYYHGQPVMITENSGHQRLYNGDHGLVLFDESAGLLVYFPSDIGVANAVETVRSIGHNRLPQHETFYAMTVHKSQGSEYATVIVVLPETDSPILSRELLYTAVTRARDRVIILANEAQLRACVERRSVRQSGLREMFWAEQVIEQVPQESNLQPEKAKDQPGVISRKNSTTQVGTTKAGKAKDATTTKAAEAKKEKSSDPVQQSLDF